jgi:hypothetical protein
MFVSMANIPSRTMMNTMLVDRWWPIADRRCTAATLHAAQATGEGDNGAKYATL